MMGKADVHWSAKEQRILGFLISKGLLLVPGILPAPSAKIEIEDVIKLGLEKEPRVIEVLPAALLHFPRTFLNWEKLPQKVTEVLDAIRRDEAVGPDLAGIRYAEMRRWANRPLRDKRVTPTKEMRIMKSFRLSPDAIARLRKMAGKGEVSETEVVERLILGDL